MIENVYGELVRIDLETLERTVLANGQFLKPVMSDDLSVVCSSDPNTMYAAGDAIVICYRNGRRIEHRLTAPAEAEITRRSVSVSPDGKYFSIWLQAGFREPLMPYIGLSYVQELGVGGEHLLTISDVGTIKWLPGDRRVVFTPIFGPGVLYDYKAGWRAMLGGREDEQVNVIVLGARDDRFLLGQERAGTRDMMFVTVGADVK